MTTTTATPQVAEVSGTYNDDGTIDVHPVWAVEGIELDRTKGSGYRVKDQRMADRLGDAMLAGAVYYNAEVRTDVNGNTYVNASSHVLGRMINADLRRLGF